MTQQTLREMIGNTIYDDDGKYPAKSTLDIILQQVYEWVDKEVIGVLEDPKNDEIGSYLKIKQKLQQLKEEL